MKVFLSQNYQAFGNLFGEASLMAEKDPLKLFKRLAFHQFGFVKFDQPNSYQYSISLDEFRLLETKVPDFGQALQWE